MHTQTSWDTHKAKYHKEISNGRRNHLAVRICKLQSVLFIFITIGY